MKQLAEYAGSREELYERLSRKLDLPVDGPAVSLDYLKSLLRHPCPYFKIERDKTRTLGIKKFRKRFDAKETLTILEKTLRKKGLKTTGFNQWSPPGIIVTFNG